jgi:hypothetical protein
MGAAHHRAEGFHTLRTNGVGGTGMSGWRVINR